MTATISQTPPMTAKKRGRPKGPTTAIGHEFMSWPMNQWITWTAPDADTAIKHARAIRNLAWRKGIGCTVRTDRESDLVIHVLKFEKETDGFSMHGFGDN